MTAGSYRSSSPARRPGSSLSGRRGSHHLCSARKSTAGLHSGPRSHRRGLHTHTCKVWGLPWASRLQSGERKEDKNHRVGCNPIGGITQSLQDQCKRINRTEERKSGEASPLVMILHLSSDQPPNNNHLSRYECVSISWVHFYILLG